MGDVMRKAYEKGWIFYRVSAKTGWNIHEAFEEITKKAIEKVRMRKEAEIMGGSQNYANNNRCCLL